MKIKKNDTVLLLTGKNSAHNKGNKANAQTGKVLAVYPKTNKVLVEGMNIQTKHKKARSAQDVSEIKKQAGPIDASNLLVVCPTCNQAVRVKFKEINGKFVRVCKKCDALLDTTKEAKAVKKATTKKKADGETATATKKTTKKSTKKVETAEPTAENN